MSAWQGVVVPAGTSPEIVARLNAEVNKALQGADLRARLAAGGSEPLGGTAERRRIVLAHAGTPARSTSPSAAGGNRMPT